MHELKIPSSTHLSKASFSSSEGFLALISKPSGLCRPHFGGFCGSTPVMTLVCSSLCCGYYGTGGLCNIHYDLACKSYSILLLLF